MSEFLAAHRETVEDLLEEALPFVMQAEPSFVALLQFSENYRIKGVVHLLLEADPGRLHRNLHCSGRAFVDGLQRMPPERIVTARAAPLFDAMACGDFAGAAHISRRLPFGWRREQEYEEDHLYMHQLGYWLQDRSADERRTAMARFETVATPEDPRVAVLQALEDSNDLAFTRALPRLALAYEARVRLFVEGGKTSSEFADTMPYLCVEAMALLRLAQRAGVQCLAECPLVPTLANGDFTSVLGDADWRRPRDR